MRNAGMRRIFIFLTFLLFFSGCRNSDTLILSDEAFLGLERETLSEVFGPRVLIREFSTLPSVEELALLAEDEGSRRIVLSPLFSSRAEALQSRLPGISVLAVVPPGDDVSPRPGRAVLDPLTALPEILKLIDAKADDARVGEGIVVVYRPGSAGFRPLAEALGDALSAGGEQRVELVEYPAETERELILARIRRELPRVLVLLDGPADTELMAGLGDALQGPLIVSSAPPPAGRGDKVYLLRPNWSAIYRSLLDKGTDRSVWWLLEPVEPMRG